MKKFRKNNKGFSLIELIIVVAIMVALIVVLAPQYLKYVERARVSADEDVIAEVVNALKVGAVGAMEEGDLEISNGTVTLSKGADATATGTNVAAILEEYYGSNWASSAKLKSKEYAAGVTVTLTTDEDTDQVTVEWAQTAASEGEGEGAGAGEGAGG